MVRSAPRHDDPVDRRAAVRRAAERPVAPRVLQALAAQNARLAPSAARDAHLDALRGGAVAVVTGQQAGLFLGPLYTLYKAASAIVDARALADESGHPVVPVFWLQVEDHDLAEIAACAVSRAQGDILDLALPVDPAARVPVAHCALPDEVVGLLDALRAELAHLPGGEVHTARLARHYQPGAGWGAAFAGVLSEVFAGEGLVFVDPRDPALAASARPVHARALARAASIGAALAARGDELRGEGAATPVALRSGSPLSFFHPDGATGPRYRLEPFDGGYRCAGAPGPNPVRSVDELRAALDADPLAFSSSALLRPIVQDTLLPTAAYVGGPAEVLYFAQITPLYEAFGLPVPLVVPRARLRVVDDRAQRILERLGLEPADAERPEDELLARCQARAADDGAPQTPEALAASLCAPFEDALARLAPALTATGQGIDAAIDKARDNVRVAVGRLAAKVEKARLHRDERLVDDVRRLRRLLFPNDVPQERRYAMATFAARFGEREFVQRVLDAVIPFDGTPRDLR